MSETYLQVTPRDPVIARDGRPFGRDQGNRMRGLGWPLPSVVAGSFRTALVKARGFDFTRKTPLELVRCEVAGVFPADDKGLYFPCPEDCVWDGKENTIRARPEIVEGGGADFPCAGLLPVLTETEFKAKPAPAWWPQREMARWLVEGKVAFNSDFLNAPIQEIRDHVALEPTTGAAAESLIFGTTGLNLTRLPRHGIKSATGLSLDQRLKAVTLSGRVTFAEPAREHFENISTWHPLGGERRLVHWQSRGAEPNAWKCPTQVEEALAKVKPGGNIRMVLATPAIYANGWLPTGIDPHTLEGQPIGDGPKLKLVGACISRWKAVSGWAYAPHAEDTGRRRIVPKDQPGPKAIRRMVPAGGVYFFQLLEGNPRILATNGWLKPISDDCYDRRDGFGLALWGTW